MCLDIVSFKFIYLKLFYVCATGISFLGGANAAAFLKKVTVKLYWINPDTATNCTVTMIIAMLFL